MTHASFHSLLQSPGVREVCELRGPVGFMAYHGGALEEMTDVIARQAAEASDASYYGVLQPFIDHVKVVVTVHGYGRDGMWTTLLLGGQNRDFAEHVAGHLRPVLPQYTVETTLRHMPRELRGLHEKNPVNLPPFQGVQIELPPRIRGKSPIWKDWQGGDMVPHMRALIDGLAAAARAWSI
jgi:phage replication-related protein YjqB (UPF0714/DUF867 family)